jgi:hypothetical protein
VGMYKLKEAMEKFCSRRKVMESLLVGTGYKPLQSVNYHDCPAHDYERSRILTGLVGFGMFWIGYVWLVNCSGQL